MTRISRLSALVGAFALSILLAACGGAAAPAPTPTDSPDAVATPSSSPSAGAESASDRPVPGFGDGCAALVPRALVTAISPDANTPHELLATQYAAYPGIPQHAAIGQLGGLLCEWSNGEPYTPQLGTSGFRGIQLSVLPDAASGWIDFAEYYGLDPAAGQVYCSGSDFYCGIDIFESGYWFNVEAFVSETPGTLDDMQALADHLRREALDFGAAREPRMPAGHIPVPIDCALLTPAALVDEVFGAGHDLGQSDHHSGGWSIWAEGYLRNGDTGCGWFGDSDGIGASWLNGGAWLAPELGATGGTPLPLSGLTDEDSATISCDASSCQVTLLVAGNWIDVDAQGSRDDAIAVTRLASHLVEVMRG